MGMPFGNAIGCMQAGSPVQREGWTKQLTVVSPSFGVYTDIIDSSTGASWVGTNEDLLSIDWQTVGA
jgi:hypothetical protein